MNTNNEGYDEATVKKSQAAVEGYLLNNFEDIKSIDFEKVYQSPMGGLTVEGTVNDEKADFSAEVESDFTVGSIGLSEGFPARKEECKVRSCDY